jgi:transcriptional regulator with XRE-family HTH domain
MDGTGALPPCGDVLRSVRTIRDLNQRELAEHCAVSRPTIERIESGRSPNPGVLTLDRILRSARFRLAVLADNDRELQIRGGSFRLYDRSGRHLPAHLPVRKIRSEMDPWWGWFRIAWSERDPNVPEHTYDRRMPPLDEYWLAHGRWQDAT